MALHDIADSPSSRSRVLSLADTCSLMTRAQADAILASPDAADADDWRDQLNLASALYVVGREPESLTAARRAVALNSQSPTALLNLSVILDSFGCYDESLSLAAEAYLLDREDINIGCNYAEALIRAGRWDEGWPLFARYHRPPMDLRPFIREWDGLADLSGRRVLVLEWGGFGDDILFLRWLVELKMRDALVTFACPSALAPLVADHPWIDAVIPTTSGVIGTLVPSAYDFFVPLSALPSLLHATADAVWPGAYLPMAPGKSLARDLARPRVGICWRAGEGNWPRRQKSLSDAQFTRLARASWPARFNWVYLQQDVAPFKDWRGTACTVADCDLVVTVDTGVAHLAGAMGVPTHVMLPGRSAWPYLLDSPSTPFYPSMTLHRNPGLGIEAAVNSVIAALESL